MTKKKILVTGATGFIGSHLVDVLIKMDYDIIATGLEKKENVAHKWIESVNYIAYDFNESRDDYYTFFNKPDALIHLAWEGLPNYNALFHFEKNLCMSYFFIKKLIEEGLKDITVLGTCFEYGMQNGSLVETMTSIPITPYAIAKDTLRKFLIEYNKKDNFILKWIRPFYLYGKGQNKNSILGQLREALDRNAKEFNMSAGEQLRDYIEVGVAAEYIAKIALQDKVAGIINCCSGKPISIRTLVENYLTSQNQTIKLNLGYYPYVEYEPMAFWGDVTKLKIILDNKL